MSNGWLMRGDVSDDQSNYSLDYDVLPAKFNLRCQEAHLEEKGFSNMPTSSLP